MLNPRLQAFYDERLEELTIAQARLAFENRELTVRELVLLYFQRIASLDKGTNGLNAVLEINPDALQIAEALDHEMQKTGFRSPLHGIPVLIKDNLATADKMHTSAGSLAMENSYAKEDAFLVKKLREAGAVILGKANMTEWANFMAEGMKNGYSSRGGQVKNPYGESLDCGGSSSGSAAAIAANLSLVSIGTETSGSILSPASKNSLVGVKPTVGLLSRTGIIPISFTQDTAGPITRTVKDAAHLLNSLVAYDRTDPITETNQSLLECDFLSVLDIDGLRGTRIGIARSGFFDDLSESHHALIEEAVNQLKKSGADVIDSVVIPSMKSAWTIDVMTHEFKVALNAYLSDFASSTSPQTLAEVIQFNSQDPANRLKYGQSILEKAEKTSGTLTEAAYLKALAFDQYESRERGIDAVLQENALDAVMFPNNIGASIPAKAGYPSVTVPAGYTPTGEPVGITFTGSAYSEPTLLKIAYSYEQATKHREPPKLSK